jgi:CDP-4-dehydro-6-deoxyglucose reductase, E1
MIYRVPLAYNLFGDDEREALQAVIRSGNLTQGSEVEKFEAAFAAWHGSNYAILVNSGSSANLVAIEAVVHLSQLRPDVFFGAFRPGDEVIVSGLCWPTTLTPLLNHGLQPVFCDIDLQTLNISVATVEAVRTGATRAIVAVPVLGNPEGLEELSRYCSSTGLALIEDACESLGAVSACGRRVGTFGLVASFSFYFSHHISTIEGGAVLTDSAELADLCYALRSHGWTRHLKHSTLTFDYGTCDGIDPRFCFFIPGYNVRPTEITAALGKVQLAKLAETVVRRRRIAAGRVAAIGSDSNRMLIPGSAIHDRHSWMTFPLMFASASHKEAGQRCLEERGIETRPIIVGNVLRHPLAPRLGLKSDQPDLPACDEVFARGLMIGLNPFSDELTEKFVYDALRAAAVA